MLNLRNKRGFTIIELIVIIAVLGILVLFGMPKLLSYVNQARLVRIQHDTRIMEEAMEEEFQNGIVQQWEDWDTNYKNLFNIVAREQLFETEGVSERVDMSYMKYQPLISANPDVNPKLIIAAMDGKLDEEELPILNTNFEVALGGPEIKEKDSTNATKDIPHTDYRVIPANFKSLIGTRLKGSFYVNALGKVYYEPDKPLTIKSDKDKSKPACFEDLLGEYEFEHLTGKITKYNGNAQHLVIPSAFLVEGKCWPVRIIGKGAFMRGNYKSIVIPKGVEKIEDNAFKDNNLTGIIIPPGVAEIGPGAFEDNNLTDDKVIIQRPENSVVIGPGAFDNNGPNKDSPVNPTYKISSDKDLGVIVYPSKDSNGNIVGGTIVSGGGGGFGGGSGSGGSSGSGGGSGSGGSGGSGGGSGSGGSGGSGGFGGSSGSGGGSGSGGVIVIPPVITVNGKEVPVTEIAAGAYQGLGLITVILPEGLERIEDYAFAGNQLIGITIPNSVNYIGNYAFAFNEVHKVGNIPGPNSIATIKTIILKEKEQFNKVNKYGDIYDLGNKVDIFSIGGQIGPNIALKSHIWVTSIGNIVIDEEYVEGMKPGDKSDLLSKLEEVTKLKESNYIAGWPQLEEAINQSNKVVSKSKPTEAEIAIAIKNLQEAINKLIINVNLSFNRNSDWIVPFSGLYNIDARGASASGRGARVEGEVELVEGDKLTFKVSAKNMGGGLGGEVTYNTNYKGTAGRNGGGGTIVNHNGSIIIASGGGGGQGGSGAGNKVYINGGAGGDGGDENSGLSGESGSNGKHSHGPRLGGSGGRSSQGGLGGRGGGGADGSKGSNGPTRYDGGGGGSGGGEGSGSGRYSGSGGGGGGGGRSYINKNIITNSKITPGYNSGDGRVTIKLINAR